MKNSGWVVCFPHESNTGLPLAPLLIVELCIGFIDNAADNSDVLPPAKKRKTSSDRPTEGTLSLYIYNTIIT